MKTILYVEEKPAVRENVIRMIEGTGFFKVLACGTVLEAIDVIEKVKADLVLVGRQVSAREVELLDHHLRRRKEVQCIWLAERKSKLASILKAFDYRLQFDTPLDPNMLMETLLAEFNLDYGGHVRGISIASFLQMIELEDKTCVLKITGAGKTGRLYCDSGRLVHAEIGGLKGKEAAFAILEADHALIEIEYGPTAEERTISAPLMSLLLESGRLKDEKPPVPADNRRHRRFDCSIPTTFFYDQWPHEARIRNISLGGVFLETQGPFSVGRQVQVALHSPSLEKGCRINGVIVRRDSGGLGVEFSPAAIHQTSILRTIIHEVQAGGRE